jgi:hypothetical protein
MVIDSGGEIRRMIMESGEVSNAGDDLQVQSVDIPVPATTIKIRMDGELAGEALVLMHVPGTFLLVSMTWHRGRDGTDVDRQRVAGALLLEAAALADQHGASLVSVVGGAEANYLTYRPDNRPVPDPWVVVTFGSSSGCGLNSCPAGVDGPYSGQAAAAAAAKRLGFMNPHTLPLTSPPVLPLSAGE